MASLELPRLEAKLRAVNAQITSALTPGDKTSYASLKAELAHLNARRLDLEAQRVARSART